MSFGESMKGGSVSESGGRRERERGERKSDKKREGGKGVEEERDLRYQMLYLRIKSSTLA